MKGPIFNLGPILNGPFLLNLCQSHNEQRGIIQLSQEYSWGEATSNHTLGSDWSPTFTYYAVLYLSVDRAMDYCTRSIVCCDGDSHREVVELFVSCILIARRSMKTIQSWIWWLSSDVEFLSLYFNRYYFSGKSKH